MNVTLPVLIGAGGAGGLLGIRLHIPGGAMIGSMLAVILVNIFADTITAVPEWFSVGVNIGLGIIIGCMYKPGMLGVVRETWGTLLISTAIIIGAGLFCAWLVCRNGILGPVGAYLATSPGGLNVLTGLAADMGQGAPVVAVYQTVRLYAILLMAPFVAPLLEKWMRTHG